jgi:hypothetical protein
MIEDLGAFAAMLNSVVGLINLMVIIAGMLSIKNGIQVIHKATNSMKDELVNEVRVASLAKGALEEKNREKSDG